MILLMILPAKPFPQAHSEARQQQKTPKVNPVAAQWGRSGHVSQFIIQKYNVGSNSDKLRRL